MNALLELPAIRERVMKFSVEDYHRFTEGQPTELLRGTILQKMSKSFLHCETVRRLFKILDRQIEPPLEVWKEDPLTFVDSEPEPDVAVIVRTKLGEEKNHPSTAEFVVEVAVSSLEIDRVKAFIYAEAGVREYWIVCPEEKRVEVYRQPGAHGYGERRDFSAPAVLECAALPGVRVDLTPLFA